MDLYYKEGTEGGRVGITSNLILTHFEVRLVPIREQAIRCKAGGHLGLK